MKITVSHVSAYKDGLKYGHDKGYTKAIDDVEKILSNGFDYILKEIRKLR